LKQGADMSMRMPIITDPEQLAEVAGTVYACLRPTGGVADAFDLAQRRLRDVVGDDRASWPASHLTLAGFGTPERPLEPSDEVAVASLVEGWAAATAPLELVIERVDVFADVRIPFLRIERTPLLASAFVDLRSRSTASGFTGTDDDIATPDWIFHLTLAYYAGDRWPDVQAAASAIALPTERCLVDHVELVGFDGGPERLLGTFPLQG
jgi:hypothetical protein